MLTWQDHAVWFRPFSGFDGRKTFANLITREGYGPRLVMLVPMQPLGITYSTFLGPTVPRVKRLVVPESGTHASSGWPDKSV